jgi:hypothetical protein
VSPCSAKGTTGGTKTCGTRAKSGPGSRNAARRPRCLDRRRILVIPILVWAIPILADSGLDRPCLDRSNPDPDPILSIPILSIPISIDSDPVDPDPDRDPILSIPIDRDRWRAPALRREAILCIVK